MRACLSLLAARLLVVPAAAYVIKRWPLATTLPIDDLTIDGSSAGPNGTVMTLGLNGSSACHDPDASCNQLRSNEPHVFHVSWCADTRGFRGVSCNLDLGYRSAQGARHGTLQYALRGLASSACDFTNASTALFPDSPFAFSNFAAPSGKNDILTVFQLSMAEGNTAGDNLALGASSGFCCRATFSGGGTVTGTLYVGDLEIRANALAEPSAPTAAAGGGAYSAGAVGGAVVGGALFGIAAALAAAVVAPSTVAAGAAYVRGSCGARNRSYASIPGPSSSLLAAARAKSLGGTAG